MELNKCFKRLNFVLLWCSLNELSSPGADEKNSAISYNISYF